MPKDFNAAPEIAATVTPGEASHGTVPGRLPADTGRRYAQMAGLVALLIGVAALASRSIEFWPPASMISAQIPMQVNTAIACVLTGIALWSLAWTRSTRGSDRIASVCAGAIAATALLTLVGYVAGSDFGVPGLLLRDPVFPATPDAAPIAPATAMEFLLLCTAILLLSRPRPRYRVAQALVFLALTLSLTSAIVRGYHADSLYQAWTLTAMPLLSAATFALLSAGLLAAAGPAGYLKVFCSRDVGGMTFRKLWLPSVVTMLLLGWLRLEGERRGLYSTEVGLSIMVVLAIVIWTVLVSRVASRFDHLAAERARAASAIRELNEALSQRILERTAELAAANRELESFAYSVSHELRAPLRAIHGFSDLLGKRLGAGLAPEVRGYLERVRANAGQMARLIDQLLAFSRLDQQSIAPQPIDTTALVQECVNALRDELAGRNVQVLTGDLPECRGDSTLLRQVWMNLLDNAFKFTAGRDEARIEVGGQKQGDEWAFYVRDNGAGFDMRYTDRLFGVFQRLHRSTEFQGTGVGLAIVRRIVQRHDGRVWAESKPGAGATFHFTLGGAGPHAA